MAWGKYSAGALGLGDPSELPRGTPGAYAEEGRVLAHLRPQSSPPPKVTVPSEVRFDHRLRTKRRVERYCFAVAAGEWHTGALVVDLAGDEIPPENLEQEI